VLAVTGWSSSLAKTLNSIGRNACASALQSSGCGIQAEDQFRQDQRNSTIGNCGPKFEIGKGFGHLTTGV